jgi:hypothetical protein
MNRLDEVLGPENWWDDFVPLEHSVVCRLTIRLPDGTVLTKCDAGGYAGLADPGDDDKSGFADAFKRTAVKFGVGRYLYRDGVPRFGHDGSARHVDIDPSPHDVVTLASPAPAALAAARPETTHTPTPPAPVARWTDESPVSPRTGRALFAWTKEQDKRFEFGLLKHLSEWARRQDFPARMVDWNPEQVAQAYTESCRRVLSLQTKQPGAEAALSV